jgi:hypothetical protein
MKQIFIIIDENIPNIHLLNDRDFEVIPTLKENVFAMSRKEKVDEKFIEEIKDSWKEKMAQGMIQGIENNIKPEGE